MFFDLTTLDLGTLRTLHDKESSRLEELLLSGALWTEVSEQRQKVKELAQLVSQKIKESNQHPVSEKSGSAG
jgi:hypothetical protein